MSSLVLSALAAVAGSLLGLILFVISHWIVQELGPGSDGADDAHRHSARFPGLAEAVQIIRGNAGWAGTFAVCAGLSWVILASRFGFGLQALCSAIFCFALIALIFIDRRTSVLPDIITLPTMWVGLGMQLIPGLATIGAEQALLGCILAYAISAIPSFLYEMLRNRTVFGGGDLKMLAMTGAWLGAGGTFIVLFISALLLVLVQSVLGQIHRRLHDEHPFGPYLGGVTLIYFLSAPVLGSPF